jgi:hypothetical protein
MTACGGDSGTTNPGTPPPTSSTAKQPGVVAGRATSEAGAPLANAVIEIRGTTLAGETTSFTPRTNAEGRYALPVADGGYTVSASYDFAFGGRMYRMQLHPVDGLDRPTLPSKDGIVTDFVWKLKGIKPQYANAAEQAFSRYGGEVKASIEDVRSESFQTNIFATEFPQGFLAEVTLTATGPLADGSTGTPIIFTHQVTTQTDIFFSGIDVPLGTYSASARATKPSGETRMMKFIGVHETGAMPTMPGVESVSFQFRPETGSTGGLTPVGLRLVYGSPYPATP